MNKHFFSAVFLLGAAALLWVAAGFFPSHALALAVTLLIASVYGFGALELLRFRQATAGLRQALNAIPEGLSALGSWLATVPAPLQNAVRLRIEGERVALPGPALTPYLVGLLVMLGMLGTFLGMVVTLNGAVFALDGTPDLAAIRSAFATPIKGLGLAFGTSVAGVASSAMLGLLSALSRRERLEAAQLLDSRIATQLHGFSLSHQRQQAYQALQLQAQALPAVANQLQALMAQMESMGRQMNERLLGQQQGFHSEVKEVYTGLARSVEQSLRDSLAHSAQLAGDSIKPLVAAAMDGIALEARQLHERMVAATQAQLENLSLRMDASAATVAERWTTVLGSHERASTGMVAGVGQSLEAFSARFEQRAQALLLAVQENYADMQAGQSDQDRQRLQAWRTALESMAAGLHSEWQQTSAQTLAQQQAICNTLTQSAGQMAAQAQQSAGATLAEVTRLLAGSEELVRARMASEAQWTAQQGARMEQMTAALQTSLGALRSDEAARGAAAVERLGDLQTALTGHLTTLGQALEEPITRLIASASEAPRAAAEVIGQLRQQVSDNLVRDNSVLEERSRIMDTLHTLLNAINHASTEQRAVIDQLVSSSAQTLEQAGSQFTEKAGAEASRIADVAAQVSGSAVEVSTLGESFGFAVQSFNAGNEKLMASLQRIEGALDKSMARSDEQLAYYVAQAREVIDLSITSQKEIVEELRQLSRQQARLSEEAA